MKVVISREKWRTGRYGRASKPHPLAGESKLKNEQGFQCCLGFYMGACGFSGEELDGYGDPIDLGKSCEDRWPDIPHWLLDGRGGASTECVSLIRLNDQQGNYTSEEREADIAAIFGRHGVEIEFSGEYPP